MSFLPPPRPVAFRFGIEMNFLRRFFPKPLYVIPGMDGMERFEVGVKGGERGERGVE